MTTTLGINGFGRIGRATLTSIIENARNDVIVSKINAPGPIETNAHLLRYDSVHGRFVGKVDVYDNNIDLGRGPIEVSSSYNAEELDWSGCDVVMECTGKFTTYDKALTHVKNGAKSVLISAPAKDVDRTVIFGVNDHEISRKDLILSNGSCTTNCLAPIAKVLNDTVGIDYGMMTTIHSYTGDQPTLDKRHDDLYRCRAAAMAMVPTSTGAAKAIGTVIPELKGKLDGTAIRVPTPNVSAIDLTFKSKKKVSVQNINDIMEDASKGYMSKVLAFDPEPKVSIDFNHTTHSSIFAPDQTRVVGESLVRILAWYDNEWAFSCRMTDVASHLGQKLM
jgi:glyceraldehyde 3-phosphate dehydrogenase